MSKPILEVEDLTVHLRTSDGIVHALEDVSFHLQKGEVLSIVGESGSGKTVTALAILRLLPKRIVKVLSGSIRYREWEILRLGEREMREVRGGRIGMAFQDPMASLNPVLTVGRQLTEGMISHRIVSNGAEAKKRAAELLELVRLPDGPRRLGEYPHQLSEGMRQRVMLAIALSCGPELLIADEPTSSLDATVQKQIADLLLDIKDELDMSIIAISHEMGVVAEIADRVAVMYAGKVVETGLVDSIFYRSKMPYTRGLLESIPRVDLVGRELTAIKGALPSLVDPPRGCRFSPRCAYAKAICFSEPPAFAEVGLGHHAACHLVGDPPSKTDEPMTQDR